MSEGNPGIHSVTPALRVPQVIGWLLYLQLAATIAMVAMWRCSPRVCSFLFDELGRPATVVNAFEGFGPPVVGTLAPALIAGVGAFKKVGWGAGLALLSLSLVMSFIELGIWVQNWS